MSFIEAVKTVFKKYAVFEGRATRAEYWWWALFNVLVSAVTGLIFVIGASTSYVIDDAFAFVALTFPAAVLYYISVFGLFLPNLAVLVRRLRDTGRKAWFLLVLLVPFFGALTLFVIALFPSKPEESATA